jgi:hypothetical protein
MTRQEQKAAALRPLHAMEVVTDKAATYPLRWTGASEPTGGHGIRRPRPGDLNKAGGRHLSVSRDDQMQQRLVALGARL